MQDYVMYQIAAALVKDGVCKKSYADIVAALTPAYFPEHYRFGGVAKPNTSPGKVDGPTMFVTANPGTYPGFDNHSVGVNEVALFETTDNGATWNKWVPISDCCDAVNIPEEPTPGPDLKQPLTFEALNDNTTINFHYNGDPGDEKTIEVSTDGGQTWTEKTASAGGTALATLGAGEKLLVRGNNSAYSDNDGFQNFFHATGDAYVYGNIMSLVSSEGFDELDEVGENAFVFLFCDWGRGFSGAWLRSKEGEPLLLPATTLAMSCYSRMFSGCTGLTEAPELPATTLAVGCYSGMFFGCTGLTEAPELPATTLAEGCYAEMFSGCTGLTEAPELPATTLAVHCYAVMFAGCTCLTEAPELPATTLAEGCYSGMFSGCMNLAYIKALFTTTPSGMYTAGWVLGVAANGTFVKSADATWNVTGDNGIPSGWTVETA